MLNILGAYCFVLLSNIDDEIIVSKYGFDEVNFTRKLPYFELISKPRQSKNFIQS